MERFERTINGLRFSVDESGALTVEREGGGTVSECDKAMLCEEVSLDILQRVSASARKSVLGPMLTHTVKRDVITLMRNLYAECTPGRVADSPAGADALTVPLDVIVKESAKSDSRYSSPVSAMFAMSFVGGAGLIKLYGPAQDGRAAPNGEHAVCHVAMTADALALAACIVQVDEHNRWHERSDKRPPLAPPMPGDDESESGPDLPGDEWKRGEGNGDA